MPGPAPLEKLAERIRRRFQGAETMDVRVLPAGQLLAFRGRVAHPLSGGEQKAPAHGPGPDGFEIYVAFQPAEAAPPGPSQRMAPPDAPGPTVWDPRTMELRLDGSTLGAEWELLDGEGHAITVRVRCGAAAPRRDVDAVLALVEEVLLRRR